MSTNNTNIKCNSVSEDFPLRVSYELVRQPAIKPIIHTHRKYNINCYNNESPEFFRLESMVQNKKGYNNPFLDEVIKVDRSEEFKKLDKTKERIKLIDQIKSNRKYSQNPNILKYIKSDFDVQMQEKREKNKNYKRNISLNNSIKINLNEEDKDINIPDTINRLNHCNPKINYKLKRHMLLTDCNEYNNNKYKVSNYDAKNFKELSCPMESRKSAFLANYNDYSISEADNYDDTKFFHFERNPVTKYNLVKDKIETIKAPPYLVPKWDAFYEKYILSIFLNLYHLIILIFHFYQILR